ncbi:glutathione S-transferase [Brucella tritici]|uniref:Glutathione S-transferase n=1 Tax=Brucella tritici TaxID=94626 RepID=A0A7V7VQK7_9HYPH|nr:glutathione S-transferase N-terminal domain-containing protein [Brucella tritici]KAB2654849.1 glutathione S-transferase [Brucella tritici]
MKLLGSLRSPYVRKALVVASEAGLRADIELVLHSVHLASHEPEVMAVNPLNKLPTLVLDDGRVLFDSLVISEFLAWKAGRDDLMPGDPEARFRVLTRHALANGLLDLAIMRLVEVAKPAERQWPEVVAACDIKMAAVLDQLEAEHETLVAEGCTIGTLALAVALIYLDFRFAFLEWRKTRPRLGAWHRDFTTRPSLRDNPFEDTSPALAGMVR